MSFERRDYETTPELRMDGDATKISGYAAVFDQFSHDLGGFKEKIAPGAFARVLGSKPNVLGLFNHDMDNLLASTAAGTLRMEEDHRGLRYEFDLDATDPDHQRVIAKVRRGDLRGSSFAFKTNPKTDEWTTDGRNYPVRIVHEVSALRDVGPVTAPAYGQTEGAGKALALRSLAELIDTPVDELTGAVDLADFLRRAAEDKSDSADAAASPSEDAAADERHTPKPLPDPRPWYSNYS